MTTKVNEELVEGNHLLHSSYEVLKLLKFRRKGKFRGTDIEVWNCINQHGKSGDFRITKPNGFTKEDYEKYMQE